MITKPRVLPPIRPNATALARVFGNAGKLLGGKAVAGLIGLVYLSLAARTLGPRDLGVLVLISFYTLLAGNFLVAQGWHTLLRFAPDCPDDAAFRRLFHFLGAIEVGSGLLAMTLAALAAAPLAPLLGWPPEAAGLAALYALAIISNMQTTPAAVLNHFGRFDLLTAQQLSGPLVRLVGAVLAWALDGGLNGFVIAWLLGSIIEGLVQWLLALYELRRRRIHVGSWSWPRNMQLSHPGIVRFLVTNNLDIGLSDATGRITPLAVGALLGPAAAGLYHLALRLGMVLAQPVLVLGRTVYPELSALAARGAHDAALKLAQRTGLIAVAFGVVVCVVFLLAGKPLLTLVGGPGFEGAYVVLLLIVVARTVHLFGFPFGSALVAFGRPQSMLWINFLATVLLLPLLVLAVRQIGLAGAGLHALAYALTTVGGVLLVLHRSARRSAPPLV